MDLLDRDAWRTGGWTGTRRASTRWRSGWAWAGGSFAGSSSRALADARLFHPFGTVEEAIARLRSIRGVGEWTAQYIALRALRETDAFPAIDLALLRGAANDAGTRPTPEDLLQRAEPWRPWRAYAAQHLWAADAVLSQRAREARHG